MDYRVQEYPGSTICFYVWRSPYRSSSRGFILGASPPRHKRGRQFLAQKSEFRTRVRIRRRESVEKVTHTFVTAIRLMEYHRTVLSSISRSRRRSSSMMRNVIRRDPFGGMHPITFDLHRTKRCTARSRKSRAISFLLIR